jgi:hypothetical protein
MADAALHFHRSHFAAADAFASDGRKIDRFCDDE